MGLSLQPCHAHSLPWGIPGATLPLTRMCRWFHGLAPGFWPGSGVCGQTVRSHGELHLFKCSDRACSLREERARPSFLAAVFTKRAYDAAQARDSGRAKMHRHSSQTQDQSKVSLFCLQLSQRGYWQRPRGHKPELTSNKGEGCALQETWMSREPRGNLCYSRLRNPSCCKWPTEKRKDPQFPFFQAFLTPQ